MRIRIKSEMGAGPMTTQNGSGSYFGFLSWNCDGWAGHEAEGEISSYPGLPSREETTPGFKRVPESENVFQRLERFQS